MTQHNDDALPSLDPENTPAGAMERAFLTETYTPDNGSLYSEEETLTSMRLMRQVLENRLKTPSEYNAHGAKTEFDILTAAGQFPEFEKTGALTTPQQKKLNDVLESTLSSQNKLYKEYREYVKTAIQVAREKLNPSDIKWPNVTGWRTQNHGSPGPGFYKIGSFGGNTFFGTKADLAAAKHHAPDAGKLYDLAHALGEPLAPNSVMHDIALHQGRPGLGRFAPLPHGHKGAPKQPHRPAGEIHEHSAHAGPNHRAEESRGFRAILAEAKAQVAAARQAREARQGVSAQRLSGSAFPGHSFAPPPANGAAGLPMRMAARNAMAGGGFGGLSAADLAPSGLPGASGTMAGAESLRPGPALPRNIPAATLPALAGAGPGAMPHEAFEQALNDCLFNACRLPPNRGAGFDLTLSPLFAGMKLPG